MSVKARFYIQTVERNANNTGKVTMSAATRGPENAQWAAYSPSGTFTINMSAKAQGAIDFFDKNRGREVSITIELAENPPCAVCGEPVTPEQTFYSFDADGRIKVQHQTLEEGKYGPADCQPPS